MFSTREEYFADFVNSYNTGDYSGANNSLNKELGRLLIDKREDYVHMLNESGIQADAGMSDDKLIGLLADNLGQNKKLALNSAILINFHNQDSSFSGQPSLNDDSVKAAYRLFSNAGGGLAGALGNIGGDAASGGGLGGAIAGAVQSGFQFGQQALQNQAQKKYGALNALAAKQQAQSQAQIAAINMQQAAIKARQAQIKAQADAQAAAQKKKKILIIGGVAAGLLIIGGIVVYVIRKKRKG